ncbi:oxidoreductase [Kitasatospora sp. NPDC096147]|uniref:oxidoreductase n=1 Tax=Kitasatospora sp. NPDC096147 TaxID=3364093 RepID=UPI003820447B
MTTGTDPLAPLAGLPGVPEAVAEVRKAADRLYGHRVMRRRAAEVTSESALRGARASAALDGADWPLEEVRRRSDFGADEQARVLGGALRVSAEVGQLLSVWRHSPLQVLARLHLLAVGEGSPAEQAGRPRRGDERAEELFPLALEAVEGPAVGGGPFAGRLPAAPPAAEAAARLDQLAQLLVARADRAPGSGAPALVVASVVHGELLALRPFASHNGVVARAAQRIVLIAEGLDPKSICPAEVGLAELGTAAYQEALLGYSSGSADGMAAWITHCGRAVGLGVRESTAVCEAMQRGMV